MMNIFNMILDAQNPTAETAYNWADKVFKVLQNFLVPILIILCGVGLIWAVVVGVQMVKADTKEKRDESKQRLIHIGITIVAVIALIAVFFLLKSWIPDLVKSAEETKGGGILNPGA